MDRIARDFRTAVRGLRRTPTFSVTAVLILALGIGMAVAMFTVFDAVLVRQLPVQQPDRLVVLWTYQDPAVELSIGRKTFEQIRPGTRTLREVAGVVHWGATPAPLVDGERSVVLNRALVTGNFFDVLGARAALGRLLRPEDDVPGAPRVIVLSYAAWQSQFGGDSAVIGRRLIEPYGQTPHTIVGVAPPGLDYPAGAGYWVPPWPGEMQMTVVARLAPNATAEDARFEFFSMAQRLAPDWHFVGAQVVPFPEAVTGRVRPVLIVLTAAVALLLLIACVNVGNLLLLRAAMREREIAIRRALGASQGDVVRQLLVESGILAAAGGVLGLLAAKVLLRVILVVAPERLPRVDVIRLAGAPLVIAVAVTLVAVLVFGVAPALLAARGTVATTLRLDARSGSGTRQRRQLRHALVASQVALALIMLAGAGLLARSLDRLQRVALGYTADHLSFLELAYPAAQYDSSRLATLGDQLASRLRAIPGVTALTPVLLPPFLGANVFRGRLDIEGQSPAEAEANPLVPLEVGGPDYFRTIGIPLLRGRGFLDSDRAEGPLVAVVSEAVARRVWPNENPIGKRIRYWGADSATWRTVVGVAGDIRYRSLREPNPSVYVPWRQGYWQGGFAIRTTGSLAAVLPALRREIRVVDPQLSLWHARTMDDLLAGPLAQPRLSAMLLSGFGLAALLLAAVGLYGVMASAVREQTRELGIRMALGATAGRVRRDVLGHALGVTVVGAAIGVAGALASSRLFTALLFEVSPTDPVTLAGVCALLVGVGGAAAYLPARRATKVDPARALRAD